MLKLNPNPTFAHAVTAKVPVDGGYREDRFRATFRVLPSAELERFDLTTVAGTGDFLRAVIVRLDELEDEAGKPVLYSDAVRDQVIGLPYASHALLDAYVAGLRGASEGN